MSHDRNGFPLRPPRAPDDLAARVLSAARRALREDRPPTFWDRVWESRPLRVAWTGATAALVLAHVLLGVATSSPRGDGGLAVARGDDHGLDEIIRLPEMEISPRAEALVLGITSASGDRVPSGSVDRNRKGEASS